MQNTAKRKLPARSAPAADARAYPIAEAFKRLGAGPVKGYQLINSGELETFKIGSRRLATDAALHRLIQNRLAESFNERPEDRAAKVNKAVAGRARRRNAQVAA
jgi:hypothetical protein